MSDENAFRTALGELVEQINDLASEVGLKPQVTPEEVLEGFDGWLERHDRGVAARALTNAVVIRAEMGQDELDLHQLRYEFELPESSRIMLNGAARAAERMLDRARLIRNGRIEL